MKVKRFFTAATIGFLLAACSDSGTSSDSPEMPDIVGEESSSSSEKTIAEEESSSSDAAITEEVSSSSSDKAVTEEESSSSSDTTTSEEDEEETSSVPVCKESNQDSVYFGKDRKYYICKDGNWVETNKVIGLYGVCNEEKKDSVVVVDKNNYMCKNNTWEKIVIDEKGVCNSAKENAIIEVSNSWGENTAYFICQNYEWKLTSKVIFENGLCTSENENVTAKVEIFYHPAYYVCQDNEWQESTEVVYNFGICTLDREGELQKKGDYYAVCTGKQWLELTLQDFKLYSSLGLCTSKRQDEENSQYVCDNGHWREMKESELLLGVCSKTNQGSFKTLEKKYICYGGNWIGEFVWELPKEYYLSPSVNYGSLVDSRDGKTYKTVKIGSQTWMAENLNYNIGSEQSACVEDDEGYCSVAGRSYSWVGAMKASETCELLECSSKLTSQGICPSGWHIPSKEDWETLSSSVEYTSLLSSIAWGEVGEESGFAVLPVPARIDCGWWGCGYDYGYRTRFWTSTEYDGENAYQWNMEKNEATLVHDLKKMGLYVRCLKD